MTNSTPCIYPRQTLLDVPQEAYMKMFIITTTKMQKTGKPPKFTKRKEF